MLSQPQTHPLLREKSPHVEMLIYNGARVCPKITGVINDAGSDDSDGVDATDSDVDNGEDNLKGLLKLLKRDEEYDNSDDGDCLDNEDENKDNQEDGPPLEDVREEVADEQCDRGAVVCHLPP